MKVSRIDRKRFLTEPDDSGPESLFRVTEGGKAAIALAFCLAVAVALVAAFWFSS